MGSIEDLPVSNKFTTFPTRCLEKISQAQLHEIGKDLFAIQRNHNERQGNDNNREHGNNGGSRIQMCVCRRSPQPMAFSAKNQRRITRMLDLPGGHDHEKEGRWKGENNDEQHRERSSVHAKKYPALSGWSRYNFGGTGHKLAIRGTLFGFKFTQSIEVGMKLRLLLLLLAVAFAGSWLAGQGR